MNKWHLVAWIIGLNTVMLAAQTNSLEIYEILTDLKSAKDDTTKADLYIRLANVYFPDDADKCIQKADMALLLADKNKDDYRRLKAYDILIKVNYAARYNLSVAMDYLVKARAIDSSKISLRDRAAFYGHEGNIYMALNDYEKSQEAFFKQIKIYDSLKDQLGLARVNFDLGNLYFNNTNYLLAIQYYQKALKTYTDLNSISEKIKTLDAIGRAYGQLREYRKNLEFSSDAMYLAEALNDKTLLAQININVGFALAHLDQEDKAVDHFEDALAFGMELNNNYLIATAGNELGMIYQKLKKDDNALLSFNQALAAAQSTGNKNLLKNVYASMYEYYEAKNDIPTAHQFLKSLIAIKDSLSNEDKMRYFTNDQLKYETEKKEQENKKLRSQYLENQILIQRQRFQNYFLLTAILALIAISYFQYRASQRRQEYNEQLEGEVQKRTLELNLSNEELIESNKRLEQSNTELERFAYIASHDLKSPLRNIISFLNLIERRLKGIGDNDLREYIRFATDNARQMHSLIQDVLEFSKIDSEKKIEKENVDLNDSIVLVVQNLQDAMQKRNAIVTSMGLPIIESNSVHVIQLFQNLISNGIKYNENTVPQVFIRYRKDEDQHMFAISDNGIGIPQEYHEQIFQMFKRLHTKDKYKGTGIGLAICTKIINHLGGKIWLESLPGKGSTFYFTIPAA